MNREEQGSSVERAAIEAAIPHRAPFLFVDRVIERSEAAIVTEWLVAPELDCFAGHYPGDPVLPGVLICEFAFQSAAILFAQPEVELPTGAIPVLSKIEGARFRRIVRPGETLRAELALEGSLGRARYVRAHVRSNGQTVLRVRFTVVLVTPAAEGV